VKILQISTIFKTKTHPITLGGAEQSARQISKGMLDQGAEVLVIHSVPNPSPMAFYEDDGRSVLDVPIRNIYWPYDGGKRNFAAKLLWHVIDDIGIVDSKVLAAIDEFAPDVALIHNVSFLSSKIIDLLKSRDIPIVQVLHDYNYICSTSMMFKGTETCKERCFVCKVTTTNRIRRLNKVDHIVAVSNDLRTRFQEAKVVDERIPFDVAYNPIDIPVAEKKEKAPGATGLVFGFLGRVSAQKGILDLLSAFKRLEGDHRLIIAGAGEKDILDEIEKANDSRISYRGFMNKVEFFPMIDVLVFPTKWPEAFGRGVIEGQAFGVPSICSNTGGLSEALGGPEFGWLYDPKEPDGLYDTLHKVTGQASDLDGYASRCIARASALVEQSKEQKIFQILKAVVAKRAAGVAKRA
jgi:glycosyltransferase involved in cell wall biosynthesis